MHKIGLCAQGHISTSIRPVQYQAHAERHLRKAHRTGGKLTVDKLLLVNLRAQSERFLITDSGVTALENKVDESQTN